MKAEHVYIDVCACRCKILMCSCDSSAVWDLRCEFALKVRSRPVTATCTGHGRAGTRGDLDSREGLRVTTWLKTTKKYI